MNKWFEIENIFIQLPKYNCYVCSPFHKNGFNLKFYYDEESNNVFSPLKNVQDNKSGFPGVLHGGFQAMLIDEIMFWAVYYNAKKITVTGNMKIQYLKPLHTECDYFIKGKLIKQQGIMYKAEGWIEDEKGNFFVKGAGTYIIPNKEEFIKGLGLETLPEIFDMLF